MQVNNHMGNNTHLNSWLAIGPLTLLVLAGSGLLTSSVLFSQYQNSTVSSTASNEIELATIETRKRISKFATVDPKSFTEVLHQSFGNKLDAHNARELTQKATLGQLPLARTITFVPTSLLEGASGAYAAEDGGLILLDERIRNDTAALSDVILHEWAHHIDASLGPVDAIGEEGDIFLRGISNFGPISPNELHQLQQSQHGHTTILFRGRYMAIEQGFFDFITAPFIYLKDLATDPINTLKKTVKAATNTVINAGKGLLKAGENLGNVVTSVAKGDFGGALGSALNFATGPGNLLNKTAEELDRVQPGLGTVGNIALGATPAGVISAGAMGLSDTVNGFKNGGLAGGLRAGLFAAVDVGMSGVGRANKGLRAAGFKAASKPKATTLFGKLKAAPGKISSTAKKKVPIYKNIDNYKFTKATPKEIDLGKSLMAPGKEKTLKRLTKLDQAPVKHGIGGTNSILIREGDRDRDGVLLGKGNSDNNNDVEAVAATVCPEVPSEALTSSVHKELIRIGYEVGSAGEKAIDAIKFFQEGCRCMGEAPQPCVTKELLTKLESTTTECDDHGFCKYVMAKDPIAVDIVSTDTITIETYSEPPPVVTSEPAPIAACAADISDLTSLRQCCDAEYDAAFSKCYDSVTEDAASACENAANVAYNSCLLTQNSRNSTGSPYTERAAKPVRISPSSPSQPAASSEPAEY